jgi:septal ring factor EnvC (AmiA/AmiB activator)
MMVWQLIAALAATPSALVIVRGLVRRLDGQSRSASKEVDWLRAELARQRQECVDEQREYEERIAAQAKSYGKLSAEKVALEARVAELRGTITRVELERDQANAVASWMAAQKGSGE